MPEAEADLVGIYAYIRDQSGSIQVARQYIGRITAFLASFQTFPERGTVRSDVRDGLRIIGFERSVSIAFLVEEADVIILRILAGGRSFEAIADPKPDFNQP